MLCLCWRRLRVALPITRITTRTTRVKARKPQNRGRTIVQSQDNQVFVCKQLVSHFTRGDNAQLLPANPWSTRLLGVVRSITIRPQASLGRSEQRRNLSSNCICSRCPACGHVTAVCCSLGIQKRHVHQRVPPQDTTKRCGSFFSRTTKQPLNLRSAQINRPCRPQKTKTWRKFVLSKTLSTFTLCCAACHKPFPSTRDERTGNNAECTTRQRHTSRRFRFKGQILAPLETETQKNVYVVHREAHLDVVCPPSDTSISSWKACAFLSHEGAATRSGSGTSTSCKQTK